MNHEDCLCYKKRIIEESQRDSPSVLHKKNARPSPKATHQKGQSRTVQDKGNEKGDARRKRYK